MIPPAAAAYMLSREERSVFAKKILNDVANIDKNDHAQRLNTVTDRIGQAIQASHAKAPEAAGPIDPRAREERLRIYLEMVNALCANPEDARQFKNFDELYEAALSAHVAFSVGEAKIAQIMNASPSQPPTTQEAESAAHALMAGKRGPRERPPRPEPTTVPSAGVPRQDGDHGPGFIESIAGAVKRHFSSDDDTSKR